MGLGSDDIVILYAHRMSFCMEEKVWYGHALRKLADDSGIIHQVDYSARLGISSSQTILKFYGRLWLR